MTNEIPEWSHLINAQDVTNKEPVVVQISANAAERAALAKRMDALEISALNAKLICDRNGAAVHVCGFLSAQVTQQCVVSLEPIHQDIEEEFEGWFADAKDAVPIAKARRDRLSEKTGKEYRILDEEDDPEPLGANGTIDLGELTAQHLALCLPVCPRIPQQQELEQDEDSNELENQKPNNPFAGLAAWREEQ